MNGNKTSGIKTFSSGAIVVINYLSYYSALDAVFHFETSSCLKVVYCIGCVQFQHPTPAEDTKIFMSALFVTGCFLRPDTKKFCLTFTTGPDRIWFCLILVSDFFYNNS